MRKRVFLRTLGGGALGLLVTPELAARMAGVTPRALALDESFWGAIRASYRLPTEYINLESGYYSIRSRSIP